MIPSANSAPAEGHPYEGFQGFQKPSELLNKDRWVDSRTGRMNFKTSALFDYDPESNQDDLK